MLRVDIAVKQRLQIACYVVQVVTRPTPVRQCVTHATANALHTSSIRDAVSLALAHVRRARKVSLSKLQAHTVAQRVLLVGSVHWLMRRQFANAALLGNTSFSRVNWHVRNATITVQQGNATRAAVVAVPASAPAALRVNLRVLKDHTVARVAQQGGFTPLLARPLAPTVHQGSTRTLPPAHLVRHATRCVLWVNSCLGAVAQARAHASRALLDNLRPPLVHTAALRAQVAIIRDQ